MYTSMCACMSQVNVAADASYYAIYAVAHPAVATKCGMSLRVDVPVPDDPSKLCSGPDAVEVRDAQTTYTYVVQGLRCSLAADNPCASLCLHRSVHVNAIHN